MANSLNNNFITPCISVVMPSYNQGQFIEESIKSVLDQSYPNCELIIADGGSKDNTLASLSNLKSVYGNRLRWISEPDTGPANAINKAIKLATADVIGWLNSDDLYASRSLSTAYLYFKTHPKCVMFYGQGEHIDALGLSLGRYPTLPPPESDQAFQNGCFICQPTVFLRRSVFDCVGLLDESLATAFDFELWMRVFKAYPKQIGFMNQLLAYSRIHADCITSKQRRLVAIENIKILKKHYNRAEIHWLQTYVNELYQSLPEDYDPLTVKSQILEVLTQVEQDLNESDVSYFKRFLHQDARFNNVL